MKVYFIFDIKKEFKNLYKGNERVLYNILKQIYHLEKNEVEYGYNLFNQLINKINKNDLDRKIFIKYHQDIPYSKRNQTHYINNLYKDEISRLTIKTSYMKLEVENNSKTFFKILSDFSENYFVCDFKNYEYFFLTSTSPKIKKNYTYLL